jgi:hypothetical protein
MSFFESSFIVLSQVSVDRSTQTNVGLGRYFEFTGVILGIRTIVVNAEPLGGLSEVVPLLIDLDLR